MQQRIAAVVLLLALGLNSSAVSTAAEVPTSQPAGIAEAPTTVITLRLDNATPKEAIAQFSKAAKTSFDTTSINWRVHEGQSVTVDLEGQPYWDALAQICALSSVMPLSATKGKVKLLEDGVGWNLRPSVVHGPFRIDAADTSLVKTLIPGVPPQKARSYTLTLSISAEPNLALSNCESWQIDTMRDENDRPIGIDKAITYPPPTFRNQQAWLIIPIIPDSSATRIAGVSGSFKVVLFSGAKSLTIPQLTEAHEHVAEVDGLEFKVTANATDDGCDIAIQVTGNDQQAQRIRALCHQAMTDGSGVFDENGRPFPCISTSIWGQGNLALRFGRSGANAPEGLGHPEKFVWRIPTGESRIKVPFEFKDVPLP